MDDQSQEDPYPDSANRIGTDRRQLRGDGAVDTTEPAAYVREPEDDATEPSDGIAGWPDTPIMAAVPAEATEDPGI